MSNRKFLGLDPGLVHTGWAVLESKGNNISYIASGVINTDAKDAMCIRLLKINEELLKIIDLYNPSFAAIEEIYVNNNYLSSLKLAHARGVVLIAPASHKLIISEYPAKIVKKTVCGSGNADKTQIAKMLSIFFPNIVPGSSDESDAVSIALCDALHHS
jgi:crossover junction endodeoxyribonuclease RuvC